MRFDPAEAEAALEAARARFGATETEREAYLAAAKALLAAGAVTKADRMEAAKLQVETARLFITIGLAALAVLGGFLQFALGRGHALGDAATAAFGATAALILTSIAAGFVAISRTYKRADGRIRDADPSVWSTAAVAGPVNLQAWAGLAAVAAFVVAIGLLDPAPPRSPAEPAPRANPGGR